MWDAAAVGLVQQSALQVASSLGLALVLALCCHMWQAPQQPAQSVRGADGQALGALSAG